MLTSLKSCSSIRYAPECDTSILRKSIVVATFKAFLITWLDSLLSYLSRIEAAPTPKISRAGSPTIFFLACRPFVRRTQGFTFLTHEGLV